MDIYLIRHAESSPSDDVEEAAWPLSENGKNQAIHLADRFDGKKIDAIYSSPYPRAIDTLKPLADKLELKINIHEDLRERKLSVGLIDNWLEEVEKTWQDFNYKLPKCESSYECQRRFYLAVMSIVENHSGESIAISSHGNAIALFLNKITEDFHFNNWKRMKNPDIFLVKFDSNKFTLIEN